METKKLSDVTHSPKKALEIIADNMIKTRPQKEVMYIPYKKSDVYCDTPLIGPRYIDLKKLYPDAKKGDCVYISTILDCSDDSNAKIYFENMADLYLDGKKIYEGSYGDTGGECEIFLKKGETPVMFKVYCCDDEKYKFSFMPTTTKYRMWAKYYLLNIRAKSPVKGFKNEDGIGISRLYKQNEEFDGVFVYPKPEKSGNIIDFNKIYPDADGECAYALTYAKEACTLTINTKNEYKIFVNGCEKKGEVQLKYNDCVLVKVYRSDDWKFEFNNAQTCIPFLTSSREYEDKWLCIGVFKNDEKDAKKYTPEDEIQFTKPYFDSDGKKMFWRLNGTNNYLRPCLPTRFFGQWFYALMVGNYGLLQASVGIGKSEYREYFIKSTKVLSTYFEYMQYEREVFGQPSFLEVGTEITNLDAIGAPGRNLCELYNISPDDETLKCINALDKALKDNIPRFDDGTFHRETDMWADDLFMSCPFIIRLGRLKGDDCYYREVVRQILGFKKKLWMPNERIFSHIYFLNTQKPNNIPWGRGNGWVYVTLTDILEKLPESFEGREEIMALYREFTESIVSLQDNDGLWHQVLNRPDSYSETSCTAMFMLGLSRGIKNKWICENYKANVLKAYEGLISQKITFDGNVLDVCMGSSNSENVDYYLKLGTVDNDDHGTGVILSAISKMLELL